MYRIKKHPGGYVVEVKKTTWYLRTYWIHFISVSGIPHQPWYFMTFDYAMQELLSEVKKETINNTIYSN